MVNFCKMWDDVCSLLNEKGSLDNDINIVKNYNEGFIVKDKEINSFVNKQDFIDFWCKMLYFNQVSQQEINNTNDKKNLKQKYIYMIISKLPYVSSERGMLKLTK